MNLELYFDYAATTPVDPEVAERMTSCLTDPGLQGNASSVDHAAGRRARALIEEARAEVAAAVHAAPDEIVFTSGATEADNLALVGAARFHASRGRHIVSTRIEHRAVLDVLEALARDGFEVTLVRPERDGIVRAEAMAAAVRDDTVLVSLMHVNNETGAIQPVREVAQHCRARNVLLHIDAAQSVGKLPLDVRALDADLVSLSAHKAHGPKGIGALWVRSHLGLEPVLKGGRQERGLRPGTLPTHQIVGMGQAFKMAAGRLEEDSAHITSLGRCLLDGLLAIGGVELNGHRDLRVPGIINVTAHGVEGESLRLALRGIALSSGAACSSAAGEPSAVLRALGRDVQLAESSLRFSFGRLTTFAEVEAAIEIARAGIERLRALAPA